MQEGANNSVYKEQTREKLRGEIAGHRKWPRDEGSRGFVVTVVAGAN